MKFKVTMKDPDGVYEAFEDAATEWAAQVQGISDEERKSIVEVRRAKIADVCGKWFEYGEYLTVEVDLDAKTCVVVPVK